MPPPARRSHLSQPLVIRPDSPRPSILGAGFDIFGDFPARSAARPRSLSMVAALGPGFDILGDWREPNNADNSMSAEHSRFDVAGDWRQQWI